MRSFAMFVVFDLSLSIPPHNFVHSPCCYYRSYEI